VRNSEGRADVLRDVRGTGSESDAELIRRCLDGDQRAYAKLVTKYKRAVYNVAWRMLGNRDDAEDVSQEAFIRAFRALRGYDAGRPFMAWLLRITSNLCIDCLRRRRPGLLSMDGVRDADGEFTSLELVDDAPGPEELHAAREERRRLVRHIMALPPLYRAVIVLRHDRDLSYNEIAEVLGVPVGTVKARIHRAHNLLRTRLQAELGG